MEIVEEKESIYVGVARVVYYLLKSGPLTTTDVADLIERSRSTAYRLMSSLEASHHVPVYFDNKRGEWSILEMEKKP